MQKKSILPLITFVFLTNSFAIGEEKWIQLNSPSIAISIIEFINSKSKGNWDTVQTISVEKLEDEYESVYRGKFKFGKSMMAKCTKYGATCNPDEYKYTCANVIVKVSSEKYEVIEWNKNIC